MRVEVVCVVRFFDLVQSGLQLIEMDVLFGIRLLPLAIADDGGHARCGQGADSNPGQ